MKDIVILMAWHEEENQEKREAFEANQASFRYYNPDVEIFLIKNRFEDQKKAWRSADLNIFQWYNDHQDSCKAARYLLVEWDCWCNCDLREYYARVWDCDVVGASVKYPERDDWSWFSKIDQLPPRARRFATGIVPFCGIMLSHKAMQNISRKILSAEFDDGFSELRLPTIASMMNMHPVANPVNSRSITWREVPALAAPQQPGLHHPIKTPCYTLPTGDL